MGQDMTIRGVPRSISRDAWWLDNEPQPAGDPADRSDQRHGGIKTLFVGLVGLIALADWLLWEREVGISLVVLAAAIFTVSVWHIRPVKSLIGPAIVLTVSVLPVIEYTQFLSVLFLFAGLAAAVMWGRRPDSGFIASWASMLRRMPLQWGRVVISPLRLLYSARKGDLTVPSWRRILRNWGLPLGGGLVFASLLIDANPILDAFFHKEREFGAIIGRAVFWLGMAVLIWPFLDVDVTPRQKKPLNWRALTFGANPQSVLRSLLVFNALIAVQTIMDVSILIGGASLPEGMTYAEYAHRGAYPLMLTALLAGSFALIANPFLSEHRSLKPLMILWLVQNVMLCVSALLRLDLYIDTYGLTYLRVYALIWMALVAIGLGITAWQVQRGHGVRWLLKRVVLLGGATLYMCCFVNFAHIIAAHNIARGEVDDYLFYDLPNTADGALILESPQMLTYGPRIHSWRDWGFREWRVREYVAAQLSAQLERSNDDPHPDH